VTCFYLHKKTTLKFTEEKFFSYACVFDKKVFMDEKFDSLKRHFANNRNVIAIQSIEAV